MALTYLILGSNSDDKELILPQAIALLASTLGTITTVSSVYESEAWGYESTNAYHNQVVVCETKHDATETLEITQEIERKLGRVTKSIEGKYLDRPIDIDILYFDKDIINTSSLIVPHQHLQDRMFVLRPLAEVAPLLEHSITKRTTQELLSDCKDTGIVRKL